ncbi:MAG: hypothetical protein ACRDL5_09035 [Solirubrobacteraceae bacterium]
MITPRGRPVILAGVATALLAVTTGSVASAAAMFPVAAAKVGDWQVTGGAGSFAVVHRRMRETIVSGPGSGDHVMVDQAEIVWLVVPVTARCRSKSGTTTAHGTSVASGAFPIPWIDNGGDTEPLSSITLTVDGKPETFGGGTLRLSGTITRTRAALTLSSSSEGCKYTVHLTAHPGRRLAAVDGEWQGKGANGQPVAFGVDDGGRAIFIAGTSSKDPAQQLTDEQPFVFGQFCTDVLASQGGGASCDTTLPESGGSPVDPCLHIGTDSALITDPAETATLGLQNVNSLSLTTGAIDAHATIHFIGMRKAVGRYTQPGDPQCSTTFTASPG